MSLYDFLGTELVYTILGYTIFTVIILVLLITLFSEKELLNQIKSKLTLDNLVIVLKYTILAVVLTSIFYLGVKWRELDRSTSAQNNMPVKFQYNDVFESDR